MRTESPIEATLLKAVQEEIDRRGMAASIETQKRAGPYRVDIAINVGEARLAIECDGAEFHASTKEQVERDKRRDRFFAAHGIPVMRFTGSEIVRSSRACAAEVGEWLDRIHTRSYSANAAMLKQISDPTARKIIIMSKWERGEIDSVAAERLIQDQGLQAA